DRQPVGFAARAGRRPFCRAARTLSDGVLHQGARRPHRRSERRLEGARLMGELGQPHAAAYRGHRRASARRAGRHTRDIVEPARRPIPAAPRPARQLSTQERHGIRVAPVLLVFVARRPYIGFAMSSALSLPPPTQGTADRLIEAAARAERDKERVVLIRDGKPVAAVVPIEDLEALEAEDEYWSRAAD